MRPCTCGRGFSCACGVGMSASIVVTALYPKGCEATHCRRFFSAIAWDFAEMGPSAYAPLRPTPPRHRAEVSA